jgi:ssDNA-binding replication factor A large subunit
MSSKPTIGNEVSVDEQANEHVESGFEAVEEGPELRPSVEQEIQATVDYADERAVEGRLFGQTLEAEERLAAREWEIERTRVRFDRRQDSDREGRTRRVAARGSVERQYEFDKRAASVDPRCDPDLSDPRERLSREMLGVVNEEATRLAEHIDCWTRAAISRRLAERVESGGSLLSAVVGVVEETKTAPGTIVPIGDLSEVWRREVSIEGTVVQLWEPSHSAISQVGLIEDETGRTKFTAWTRSRVPLVDEGERVRFRGVQKSWYQGRCSVALTGDSLVEFPEREAWFQG